MYPYMLRFNWLVKSDEKEIAGTVPAILLFLLGYGCNPELVPGANGLFTEWFEYHCL